MDAKTIAIESLLGANENASLNLYRIPAYQRDYKWKEKEYENLFDDINDNDVGYFLGSIICVESSDDNNIQIQDIIDGQQRLTTISILLCSIFKKIYEYNKNNPEEKILDISENVETAEAFLSLRRKIVITVGGIESIRLTVRDANKAGYEYIIISNNISIKRSVVEQPAYFGSTRICKAYEYFNNRLSEFETINMLFDFLRKVYRALLVKITVPDVTQAYTLFECINNRGMPLEVSDLIKNFFFGKLERVKKEEIDQQWQEFTENIQSNEDQIRFLRHYYHAFRDDHTCLGDGRNLVVNGFMKATKSNVLEIYTDLIKRNPSNMFEQILEKGVIYQSFLHPGNISIEHKFYKYRNKFADLNRLEVKPSYALFLYILSDDNHDHQLFNFIENWYIRRHITNFPRTAQLDQIFLDLISHLRNNNGYDFDLVVEFLTKPENYATDEIFTTNLLSENLYKKSSSILRCLFIKLEMSLRNNENQIDPNRIQDWTIEHIYPQKPANNAGWEDYFTQEDRANCLHKIGNLTLTCYNANLGNAAYEIKCNYKNAQGQNVGLQSGTVRINKYMLNRDSWKPENVHERSMELIAEIIKLVTPTYGRCGRAAI